MSEITTPPEVGAPGAPAISLQVLRTRLFELAILCWSLPFGLAILTIFKVVRSPALVRWVLRLWSSGFILAARHIVGVRYRLEGTGNIPDGPVVFVGNHQSYWESIAFTAFFPHINVVTKAEAMDIPVFGWGLRHAPMTPVFRTRRGANLRRIVREARISLAEGRSVLIFPEGTRVRPGCVRPHLRGLGLLYGACAVPLVPVVHNAGLFWSAGFGLKRAGEIVVRFHPPIPPGGDPTQVAREMEALLNREKDSLLSRPGRSERQPAPA
jgi:1-acyl-sn-glycerol-3-phosphate acyltransferase